MKYLKQEKKGARGIGRVILAIVLLAGAFAGGFWFGGARTAVSDELEQVLQGDSAESREEASAGVWKPQVCTLTETDVVVPTPYGEIYYPVLFEEFLRVTHEFSDAYYGVHFNADIGVGEIVNIFSVFFAPDTGRQPEGNIIGGIQVENGSDLLVIVAVNAEIPGAGWDADTQNLVYAMQEGIAGCVEKLSGLEGFLPG